MAKQKRNITETQKKNLIPLNQRSPEERKRISQMGVEARKNKKREEMQVQKVMRTILGMRVSNKKMREQLRTLGFEDEELTNEMVLMLALFKKGLTGNVEAIREVVNMQDKLDAVENGHKVAGQNITINLVPQGTVTNTEEDEEQNIWEVDTEDNELWNDEQPDLTEYDDEDWGDDDVYNP